MSETNKNRVISDEECETLTTAFESMLSVVRSMGGETKDLPASFTNCGERDKAAIAMRGLEAMQAWQNYKDRAVLVKARGIVNEVIEASKAKALEGYKAVAALLVKSPEAAAFLGDRANPPENAHVSINDVRHAYPEGMSDEAIIALLHRSNYSLVKGKSKDGTPRIAVKLTPEDVKAFLAAQ
jgi:hypothetical protein